MPTATIDAEIMLRTERLLAELKKLPNVTAQEAKAMAAAVNREWKKAEDAAAKASKKAAAEAAKARAEAERGLEAMGKALAQQFGGPIAQLADLSTSTAGALGAVGAAGFAAVAGVGALGAGAKALADEALEAVERLDDMGLAAMIPPEARESLQGYENASSDLRTELDLLTVTLGAGVAGGLADVAHATIGVVEGMKAIGSEVDDITGPLSKAGYALSWVSPARWELWALEKAFGAAKEEGEAVSEMLRDQADAAKDAATEHEKLLDAMPFYGPTTQDLKAGGEILAEANRKAAEAARAHEKAAREDAEALREQARATADRTKSAEEEKLRVARAAYAAHQHALALEENVEAMRDTARSADDLQRQIDDLERSWAGATAPAVMAIEVWQEQLDGFLTSPITEKIGEIASDIADLFTAANDREIESLEDRHQRQLDAFEEERQARRDQVDEWLAGEEERLQAMIDAGKLSEEQAQNERKRLQLELNAKRQAAAEETRVAREQLEERHRHQVQLARKAFKENQSFQIAQAAIESIRAGISLIPAFASLPPPVSFGAPALAAGAALAQFAIASAAIRAQSPPEFPMGRAPSEDHTVSARLRPDEAVLPGWLVAEMGGRRAVQDLIHHGPRSGGVVNLHVDSRLVSSQVLDQMAGDARFAAPGWMAGQRPLYGI